MQSKKIEDLTYEMLKSMPDNEKVEVYDFVKYLINKREQKLDKVLKILDNTKRKLNELGYNEENIDELVHEVRESDD
ncbi:DUF2281 domain-containing protein [Thermoanaerobacterium thermosaccharolyticum]|uniref:DUF2281 domain-containing protein n=1 Tax=Thermoanaerobacterium thermosaccharolyticum TaxID=1517 RepID=UPI003D2A4AA4